MFWMKQKSERKNDGEEEHSGGEKWGAKERTKKKSPHKDRESMKDPKSKKKEAGVLRAIHRTKGVGIKKRGAKAEIEIPGRRDRKRTGFIRVQQADRNRKVF